LAKKEDSRSSRLDFMTEEQMRRIDNYLTKIEQNRGNLGDIYDRMEAEQEAYSGDQELKDNRPNTRVNIVNANIEGQVSALVEQNLAVVCKGEGPSDHPFAKWAQIGLDWTFRKNKIKRVLKTHERRRELFGWGWLKIYFDPDAINGFGMVRLTTPPLQNIFIDMAINDPSQVQDAEYIAEVIQRSKSWAERQEKYGDRAKNILYGGSDKASIFQKEKTTDDEDTFWLIQLWTMTDGMLRLEEFSDDGVLLYDSFEDPEIGKKPFNRYNKYPYFLTIMYPEEGELYGFGDGKLLRPLQDMLNDLYDQIRRAARPNRIFFDPNSEVELEDLDEDDGPIPCTDPNTNIRVVEAGRVNPALWQLLESVHREIQRVTRFSELMMGQSTKAQTATESAIQHQQGNSATDSKKLDLGETMPEVAEYILDLMMENYTEGRAFRIDEDKEDYVWVDFRQLNELPVLVPPNDAYSQQYRAENPGTEMPKWMQLADESGNGMTKSVDLDIEISFGAGLPKNKAFLWQMMESLSRVVVAGQPVLTWQEFRAFINDYLGIPLDENQPMMLPPGMPGAPGQVPFPGPAQPMQNANVQGMTPGGAPMMGSLPQGGRIGGAL